MAKFCTHERHGGICNKTDTYCNLGACPYEEMADFVLLVRCKGCKYFDKATPNDKGFCICPASGMEVVPDDFCSYGERKDGASLCG